jgi:benzil reductase ((S)-benzoin forming)
MVAFLSYCRLRKSNGTHRVKTKTQRLFPSLLNDLPVKLIPLPCLLAKQLPLPTFTHQFIPAMHYFIITGASRGIGAALAAQLLKPNHLVIGVARSDNPDLKDEAQQQGVPLRYFQQDLSESFNLTHFSQVLLGEISREEAESVTLIHNAGLLTPIAQIGQESSAEDYTRSLNVNLLAPMIMSEAFVSHLQEWPIPKRLIGISSGAAFNPYPGWSTYCTTKAGLDMYLRTLATEQQSQAHPITAVALAPGVVDTEMQTLIRQQSAENFPPVQRFHELKDNHELWTTDFVAEQIIELMLADDFGQQIQIDLRG